jgi:hypothetical protein
MNLPETHPLWMWLYFGVFGSAGVILITLIVWQWIRFHALAKGYLRSAASGVLPSSALPMGQGSSNVS